MATPTRLASAAALIAHPARAAMLQALMAGEALTAGELARTAGIAPSTASAHLAALAGGALVVAHAQGRHRWFRLANDDVAAILESLMGLAELARPARRWPHGEALRTARTCWDHLAGRLGVALRQGLVERGMLRPALGGWEATAAGHAWLERTGVDVAAARRARRFACDCMDWSERRPHLGGGLARALCTLCLARGWLRRQPGEGLARRAVVPTPEGVRRLREAFGVRVEAAAGQAASD
ncbi:helix-turn-helix transcriptional regulator [Elioraea sp. Yellowstone]|jgi:DNA-binding transcriptional ArsR family regulator|uniref:ArsR/SmtB family transcription factor n=1 Tax=Elioraea sp. Yellowstone TaxID=2592070 RepID=UPI00114E08AB|nr:helix-turn-helix transcriptional regulator [Elioraea sp. Yellowstone]TQF76640.1 helix-turn-helix transcriptional regulator [Elioraea sp. Yellowstone]